MEPPPRSDEPRRVRSGTAPHRRALDRAATWLVVAGGLGVVASLLGILLFLLAEALPLARPVRVELGPAIVAPLAGAAIALDASRTQLASLGPDGVLRARDAATGAVLSEQALALGGPLAALRALPGDTAFAGRTADGQIALLPFVWQRPGGLLPGDPVLLRVAGPGESIVAHAARRAESVTTAAAVLASGALRVSSEREQVNPITGEREHTRALREQSAPADIAALALDAEARNLYGVRGSELLWWRLDEPELGSPRRYALAAPATALAALAGGRSLVTGGADGSLTVWLPVPRDGAPPELVPVRRLAGTGSAVAEIAPAARGRCFLVRAADGGLSLYHATTERLLWRGASPLAAAEALGYAPRGDGAVVSGSHGWQLLAIANPHPEVSLRALFGSLWYEDYPAPAFVWQSTGGTDAFEPKLSLVPLLVGTLKGALYALLLALPLGVLGAVYTSQFMHARYQRAIKPAIELMASLPSVVLGFLAGLWLAPRLERAFPGLLLAVVGLPAASIAAGAAWQALPRRATGRLPEGSELALHAVLLPLAGLACLALGRPFEVLAFGGDFAAWLERSTGLVYEQRNAIVAGIAMGFAVIPIIFSISEDSLSNVPRSLVAASLALGATRWQTVLRVVLPAASPGLLAAAMIGIGRAIGETMIVLMAAGNTPLVDWSAFDGFRALSANLAVEIPEAPDGGTLYRTLFASALLLFALTFALNTAAELVRQRIRRRFAGE